MELKTIKVPKNIHQKIREQAAKEGITIMQLITKIFLKYVTTLSILLSIVGCGTVRYVQVDEVNMKRFQHEQKADYGMTKQEALNLFGSPDQADDIVWANMGVHRWRYHHKIFCGHLGTRCDLIFKEGKLISHTNFRMEFTNVVAN